MTTLGKILVLVNLVFSFLAFSWALTLYLNRIDYTDTPAVEAQGKPAGELVARKERLKELEPVSRRPGAAVRAAKRDLAAVEAGTTPSRLGARPANRDWYEAETDLVRHGSPPLVAPPRRVHEVVMVKGAAKL